MEGDKKKKRRNTSWMLILLVLLIAAFSLFLLYRTGAIFGNRNRENGTKVSLDRTVSFDTSKAVKETRENLSDPDFREQASAFKAYPSSQRKVMLVFLGMGTPTQMAKIRSLLNQYKVKAVFLVDGASASEDAESLQALAGDGNVIGNCGFDAEKKWEKMDRDNLAVSLAKTQSILETELDRKPKYFMGSQTTPDRRILKVGAAAGLKKYIVPTCYLNYGSFSSFSAALGMTEKLRDGDIICIKINDVLSKKEYEAMEIDQDPAEDKKSSKKPDKAAAPEQDNITSVVENLLKALYWTRTAVTPVHRYRIDPDPVVRREFRETEFSRDYEIAKTPAHPKEWLDHSLFIGDSLTQGFQAFADPGRHSVVCAYRSVSAMQFVNNTEVTNLHGRKEHAWDAVCRAKPKKIYILLGTNVLASGSSDNLITYYQRLITMLKKQFPDVPIYVQGMPPVTRSTSEERPALSNWRIRTENVEIAKMAKNSGAYYIDLYHAFAGRDKALPEGYARSDGIHLNAAGCEKWQEYLLCHDGSKGKKKKR